MRSVLFIIFFVWSVIVMAQTPCDSLKVQKELLKNIAQANRLEKNVQKRKTSYQSYLANSQKAISIAKRCFANPKAAAGSLEELKNNYMLGKLLYGSGNCIEAKKTFRLCLNNPNCTEKINGTRSYAEVIASAFSNCNTYSQNEASPYNGYITYSGKGGSFAKQIFDNIEPSYFDDTPLNVDEIEAIAERTIQSTDIIDTSLVRSLSGNAEYVLNFPFLLMQATSKFASIPVLQEKNMNFNSESGIQPPKLEDFNGFISKRFIDFKTLYFDKFNTNGRLIPIYLVGGRYDAKGLLSYLDFCKTIHYRANKRVAYYLSFDNSMMVWVASGGGTLIHELLHALMANDNPEAPLWINEGIASLFEEADNNGVPLNNYRLIFIHQLYAKQNICIDWTSLMDMEKYVNQDELNYNLLNAYSRYFCKFIYDKYGNEMLAQIYKSIRDKNLKTNQEQVTSITEIIHKSSAEIQQEWQEYLFGESIPKKWLQLIPQVANSFKDKHEFLFTLSDTPLSENSITKLNTFYKEENKKNKHRSGISHGKGPQQF